MTVPSLLMVSMLQRRGVEHKVLVARDLCSRLSSLTLRGTREGDGSAQWTLLNLVLWKPAGCPLGRAQWQLLFLSVALYSLVL